MVLKLGEKVFYQCAVEEATELELGIRGFTTYAKPCLPVVLKSICDGDDTPIQSILASAYASRGLKLDLPLVLARS